MTIPQLQVRTQPAKLNLESVAVKHEYKQFKADQSIEQPQADLSLSQRPGKLTIDQSSAWSNLHLKSIFERTRDIADFAEQTWLEGIGKAAQEGDELMRIENKSNAIANIAGRYTGFEHTYVPGNTPVHDLVNISYQANEADIDVKRNEPIIDTTPVYPKFQYQKGAVNVTMGQMPSISIDWKV
ncbi:DUF6470 family protein [Halobacillus salinus]|uniref:Uncharacterized protein n=1 Tax=Halobacillus salinus TaxID=192814 RepID=A0A4Z0GX14_9BACI|nr:DUF6470 family protein [Halobacillus salinus]TGB02369.1 hypothetical protein E4663_13580 [Halobacillus salinus]